MHSLDRTSHDGQADSRALVIALRLKAFENAKDFLVIIGSDADSVIFDEDADPGLTRRRLIAMGFLSSADRSGNEWHR